ncbi:transcription termination factor MTEF18, mitochondrial-like isoform X1 [Coffea arabica]|uniref:Transcription termination factor MTEF18, mitochondrial-like isoform X1 n=2 Tax=Coffea arabica TaxID=13443 RepID=A0ABM4UPJ1_COFAR|nr:transcription termination factor MTEF18, mitochondrial-like [Coffea arabica]
MVLAHLQKLGKPSIVKWVSIGFVNNNFRVSRSNFWAIWGTGSCQIAKNFSGYSRKKARMMEIAAEKEAQAALLDYLHSTRSLLFTDADNMSRNSPHFLRKLLGKVDNQAEIGRSITRFLRYHPINEFEPFFESMGLKPSEYSTLLPRQLMFLNDDPVLLENYHVLCNYGIARNKVGKFYKEVPEIFRYGEGVLQKKIDSFEKVGLSQSTVIRAVLSSPYLLVGDANLEFFDVLDKLRSADPAFDWIEHLMEENSYDWRQMLEILCLLGKMGCSEEQLGSLIRKHPELIFENSGSDALLLIGVLTKFGLRPDEICSTFLQFPQIPIAKFLGNLKHCYNFLVEIEMAMLDVGRIVCSQTILLGSCTIKKLETLLTALRVTKDQLCEIVKENPEVMENWVVGKKIKRLPNLTAEEEELRSQRMKTEFLLDLGFVENSEEMKRALKLFRGKGLNLQERFDCFVNAGFSKKDVAEMVKDSPNILNLSKDAIETKIEFLVNDLGYPVSILRKFPPCISYKIERIKLRLTMYNWLKDQGAVEPNLALSTVLATADKLFIKAYVEQHPEGPAVYERLKQTICSH